MRIDTPPILALVALDAALDVWDGVDIAVMRRATLALADGFIVEVEARCHDFTLASPRDGTRRGSRVSLRHPEEYAIMQALIARDVIGDLRAPDMVRFGLTPLYIGEDDIRAAVAVIAALMATRARDDPAYRTQGLVT